MCAAVASCFPNCQKYKCILIIDSLDAKKKKLAREIIYYFIDVRILHSYPSNRIHRISVDARQLATVI